MAAHAIWSGAINFGLVTIPVKLYSAIRQHELHFNYLHAKDEGRIHNERVCSVCGERVEWNDIVRGFEVQKGEYVVLKDEDFRKASPDASQSVEIVSFVRLDEIDPVLFDVPYYLEPERRGRHAYAILRDSLRRSGRVGIARVVLRSREHLAALEPHGNALVIEMMHWADEVIAPTELEFPQTDGKVAAAEMKMASMLIDSMTAKFDPGEFKDHYRDELVALIEARAAGKPAPRGKAKPRATTNVLDLTAVLEKSLAQAKKKAPGPRKARASHRRRSPHAA
jgi:DNA end-binding protein Ku